MYVTYAYNVNVGKFWDGEWFTATRKYAAPVDARFWARFRPHHSKNTTFMRSKAAK